jgi:hypothetical protein
MAQVQKVKIFLASPSDVLTERKHVKKVIDELNRHVAAARGVVLEVVSSEYAIPGFGKDGQSIVNQQIARMSNYDLFIGVMWKRIGTPTARAKSGTVEEYRRAVRTFKNTGHPEIWFYFRKPITKFKNKEEEAQQNAVLKFRKQVGSNALFRDYTSSADFAKQLREHLTSWLLNRKRQRKATTTRTTAKKVPSPRTTSTVSAKSSSSPIVRGPGSWIMLNNSFFPARSSKIQTDKSIVLKISLTDREKIAQLKSLYPKDFYRNKQVTYADNLEAAIMEVSTIHAESSAGKPTFDIELKPIGRTQGHLSGLGFYGGYNALEVATQHARLLLLGEPLSQELSRFYSKPYIAGPSNQSVSIETSIFPSLWTALNTLPRLFLPQAWLWAAYHLKMTNIVEDILELKLGPIKNKVMAVQFRGKRSSSNNQSEIIQVVGECTLHQ